MTDRSQLTAVAAALRSPFVPAVFRLLAEADGYLAAVWPQLAPSIETTGFIESALYMAQLARDGVEEVWVPGLTRGTLRVAGLEPADLNAIAAVLDVFEWVQPQSLLICAALAEASQRSGVGGQGKPERRITAKREAEHLETSVAFVRDTPLLTAIAQALATDPAPELYEAVAVWPIYAEAAWAQLQHLSAFPGLRRRARALYYYARSASRFLAVPIQASGPELSVRGVLEDAQADARGALDAALLTTATMMVHCAAMQVGLGITGETA